MQDKLTVKRNEVDFDLAKQVLGKKSKENAGKEFFAPVMSPDNWSISSVWVGVKELCGMANAVLRRVGVDIALDAVDENTGLLNLDKVKEQWADFTAGAVKLSELEEEIDNLVAQQMKAADSEDFGATNPDGTPTEAATALLEQIKKVNSQLKELKAEYADRTKQYEARAAKRKDKKTTQKIATQAAQPVTA